MEQPLISIVTPVFNAAATLPVALNSIRQQNYSQVQHIVIDGGSTDGSVQIIEEHAAHLAHWISEPDKGIYNAMNKGLAQAKGQLIGILNADDCYYPNTLQTVAKAFADHPQADIFHGNLTRFRQFDDRCSFHTATPKPELLKETMTIFHPTCFVKKQVYDELGTFDERYRIAADYEFMLRALLAGKQFHYINRPLACFRVAGQSNADCTSYEEAYRIHLRYKTGFAEAMLEREKQCKRKLRQKKIISTLAHALGMRKQLEKRIMRQWDKK